MFWNYFTMALRQLRRHKLLSAINILGLSVSLTACLLMLLFIQKELSFDRFWSNSDNLYQARVTNEFGDKKDKVGSNFSRMETVSDIRQNFPKIEAISFVAISRSPYKVGDKIFQEIFSEAEPDILNIFDFDVIEGNLKLTMQDPSSIAINRSTAMKFFGSVSAIGMIMTTSKGDQVNAYKVGAVYEDHPANTILKFSGLVTLDPSTLFIQKSLPNGSIHTSRRSANIYFKAPKGFDSDEAAKSKLLISPNRFPTVREAKFTPLLLTMSYLSPQGIQQAQALTPIERITILALITALVLLMACINFINLSTARATQRAKEVALRKLLGAKRSQIIVQFLGEAIIIVMFSLFMAFVLAEVMLPYLNQYANISMTLSYANLQAIAAITALILIIGIGSGSYPAFIISALRPVQNLHGSHSNSKSSAPRLRQFLIVLQFTISTILLVLTTALYSQTIYTSKMDLGYDADNLIQVVGANSVFKQEAIKLANITNASSSSLMIISGKTSGFTIRPPASENFLGIVHERLDSDFLPTLNVKLIAGRGLTESDVQLPFDKANVIINEEARKEFGFSSAEEAIGNIFTIMPNQEATIVGVTPNLIINSMQEPVKPYLYLSATPNQGNIFTARYKGDPKKSIAVLKAIWQDMFPEQPFTYHLVEDRIANDFKSERQQATALGITSSLAILIACLGLYGLASFTAEQRTREIGVRKVMGASTKQIMQLLIWQFSKPIFLAILIAWPVAAYIALGFLEKFTYRYENIWLGVICLGVGLLTLMIAWLTVGTQAALVARANPINALRDE